MSTTASTQQARVERLYVPAGPGADLEPCAETTYIEHGSLVAELNKTHDPDLAGRCEAAVLVKLGSDVEDDEWCQVVLSNVADRETTLDIFNKVERQVALLSDHIWALDRGRLGEVEQVTYSRRQ